MSMTGLLMEKSEWDEVSILVGMESFQDGRGQSIKSWAVIAGCPKDKDVPGIICVISYTF